MKIKASYSNEIFWKESAVYSKLPRELKVLEEIAYNVWWVWNYDARDLFASLDRALWRKTESNPVLMLQQLSYQRLEEITKDGAMMNEINRIHAKFKAYMQQPQRTDIPSIAYFSMEYGLCNILKIYSGGLGVLAGDYIKEASDMNVNLTAVGFLYRYGYFTQSLSMDGQQIANYEPQRFDQLPLKQVMDNNKPMVLEVPYDGFNVYCNVWTVSVGRINLYLLDTDINQNPEWDRAITHKLYGGDNENRLKQEYLLGVGGIILLNRLGINKQIYHLNEGHAALINACRLIWFIENRGLAFNEALEIVRASSLYTCHTPVPAGHDYFEEHIFRKYMSYFPERLGITWQEFMDMGRENPGSNEKFSMSVFALNTCQEANGVSYLHGEVSKRMFAPVWKGYFPSELHVNYVTNGVHMPTWAASEFLKVYERYFQSDFYDNQSNPKVWEKIHQVDDEEIWDVRVRLKNRLVSYIKEQFKDTWLKNQGDPSKVISILEKINPNALLIGFGRRFATYKRAHLLFTDLERLAKIVNNTANPVQIIYTGKAHPADGGGQSLIRHIVEISQRPEFLGKIIFLENYDMRLAKRLVSGVDVWLNTPTRPLEASGTSGEKAEMNGVLNFSVLDGWWYEGYREDAGWALTDKRTYDNQQFQDQLDAATIYSILENEIIPLYYAKNSKGYSPSWVQYIKNSLVEIAPHYTTRRMFEDYNSKFYGKLANRSAILSASGYAKAKELAAWKENVAANWDSIEIVSCRIDDLQKGFEIGDNIKGSLVIDKHNITGALGAEIVKIYTDLVTGEERIKVTPFNIEKIEGSRITYTFTSKAINSGAFKMGIRLFPDNPDIPHRMDFAYVKWVNF
ncbi:MAG: alpha-glucan family phosphorylase [Dysgonamonadaceae bacterium]|jgi:starch phosphorylase|nr:alpha-glucan family phosphorylase [Dysgonamonadaceae bacterium]